MIIKIMALDGFYRLLNRPAFAKLAALVSVNGLLLATYAVASALPSSANLSIKDARLAAKADINSPLIASTDNLMLQSYFSKALDIPEPAIQWEISDAKGLPVQQVQGSEHALKLAAGTYQIELKIGKFALSKQIELKDDVLTKPYFKAEIGRLDLSANHPADWSINGLSHTPTSFETKDTQQLVEFVPAGFYEVTPRHGGVERRQVVHVLADDVTELHIDIPMVDVNLIAVENNQPFFKPVEWSVFRLEHGERQHVGSYHQHSQGISVPAGFYEVIASYNSKIRSRQFWVKENTTNKIVLAMD